MELSPAEFTRLLERLVQAIAEMPSIDSGDLSTDDYLLIKDNLTNQPKKVSMAQVATLLSSSGLVADTGTQTIGGAKTFSADTTFLSETIKGDAAVGFGLYRLKSKTATKVFANGATETIPVQVPANALIAAIQLRNDTLIVGGGGAATYTADLSVGGSVIATSPTAFAKNTKTNTIGVNYVTLTAQDIVLTPDVGTLATGTVTAIVYYYELVSITNAP